MKTKTFIIGFNKCGTTTLKKFFSDNGVRSVHWKRGDLALSIQKNIAIFSNPLSGYMSYEVYSDMEYINQKEYPAIEAYKYYEVLYSWYPDAKFILNTRSVEGWIKSRLKHGNGDYLKWYKHHYALNSSEEVERKWRIDFFKHHYKVLKFFNDKPDSLVVFDIEKDDPEKLCKFFHGVYDLDPDLYGHHNRS